MLYLPGNVIAQPGPDQLANQLIDLNNERLSNIESVEITIQMAAMGITNQSTTQLIKRSENGESWLEPLYDDSDTDMVSGVFDEQLPALIRGASSVSNDVFDGHSLYMIVIDDVDLFNELASADMEFTEDDFQIKKATIWLDQDELIARRVNFEQSDVSEGEMSIDIFFNDYRYYEGLPIAHSIEYSIHGIETQISEDDIAEARSAMRRMEEQLEQMPEAQRKVIEQQLKPQMEQFETMIESGGMTEMEIIVTDVKINP